MRCCAVICQAVTGASRWQTGQRSTRPAPQTETELKSPPLADISLSLLRSVLSFLPVSLSLSLSFLSKLHDRVSRGAVGMGLLVLIKFERKGANPLASSHGFVLPSKSELTTPNFRYRSGKFWCCLIPHTSLLLTEGMLSGSLLLAEVQTELVLGPARGSQRALLHQWAESHRSYCTSLPLVGECVCGHKLNGKLKEAQFWDVFPFLHFRKLSAGLAVWNYGGWWSVSRLAGILSMQWDEGPGWVTYITNPLSWASSDLYGNGFVMFQSPL